MSATGYIQHIKNKDYLSLFSTGVRRGGIPDVDDDDDDDDAPSDRFRSGSSRPPAGGSRVPPPWPLPLNPPPPLLVGILHLGHTMRVRGQVGSGRWSDSWCRAGGTGVSGTREGRPRNALCGFARYGKGWLPGHCRRGGGILAIREAPSMGWDWHVGSVCARKGSWVGGPCRLPSAGAIMRFRYPRWQPTKTLSLLQPIMQTSCPPGAQTPQPSGSIKGGHLPSW